MSKENNFVFIFLKVIAWVFFVGLCIEAGGLLVNFVISIYKPDITKNLYQKLDLSEIYLQSKWIYFGLYGFILFIAFLKAFLFYLVINMLFKLDIEKPFSHFVSKKIVHISWITFCIGLISHIGKEIAQNMNHHGIRTDQLQPFWADGSAYILMAAVIYVIATIFKKGIDIQTENDLTV